MSLFLILILGVWLLIGIASTILVDIIYFKRKYSWDVEDIYLIVVSGIGGMCTLVVNFEFVIKYFLEKRDEKNRLKEKDIKKEEKQGKKKENKNILIKNQFYIPDLA